MPQDSFAAAVALIVSFLLGIIAAYVHTYFSEKAKRAVIREEFRQILEETRQASEATEQGKRDVITREFDQIINELKRTTNCVEEVRASVSGDLWLKQRVWQEKRDIYRELLLAGNKIAFGFANLAAGDPLAPHDLGSRLGAFMQMKDIADVFVTDPDVIALLNEARWYRPPETQDRETLRKFFEQEMSSMVAFLKRLTAAAQKDLGVSRDRA